MSYFFCFLGVCCYALAFGSCAIAKTSINEIQGGIIMIVGTLFMVSAGIIDAITATRRALVNSAQQPPVPTLQPERPVVCGACKKAISPGVAQCPHCGTKLVAPA